MLISLSWLKEFVHFDLDAQKTAELLSDLGLETEVKDNNTLDIEVTPNRGDCLSVLGVAREIAAKLNKSVRLPAAKIKEDKGGLNLDLKFSAAAEKLTYRYTYRIIKGVKIKSSPNWIQEKLASYGFRSINNIVDITNLVMIELGQPLHAFDYEKLGGRLFLRTAEEKESVITLDGKERKLNKGMLVAEDKEGRLVDLCGIMGGFYSEVDEKTKTIVLQAAVFDPVNIRLTSKKLRHQTDASYRYERAVDFEITKLALDRATALILATAGGKALPKRDIVFKKPQLRKIKFSLQQLNYLLGGFFTADQVEEVLQKLNFVVHRNKDNFSVQPPSYRWFDIYYWQDVAEEVLRVKGYSVLSPQPLEANQKPANLEFCSKEFLKDKLAELGFSETLSYSFISRKDTDLFALKKQDLLKVRNPLSLENEYFRPVLLINVLKQVAANPWFSEVKIFEIGHIADKKGERQHLVVLLAKKKGEQELKEIQKMLLTFGLETKVQAVDQNILQKLKIKKPIFYIETDLVSFRKQEPRFASTRMPQVKTPSFYPPAQVDLSFFVPRQVRAEEIERYLSSHPRVILVELFDEFESDRFGKDRKSIAFHLWLEDRKRALRDEEIEKIMQDLAQTVEKRFKAQWRRA